MSCLSAGDSFDMVGEVGKLARAVLNNAHSCNVKNNDCEKRISINKEKLPVSWGHGNVYAKLRV